MDVFFACVDYFILNGIGPKHPLYNWVLMMCSGWLDACIMSGQFFVY